MLYFYNLFYIIIAKRLVGLYVLNIWGLFNGVGIIWNKSLRGCDSFRIRGI